jgi:hypothetical protein
MKNRKTKLEIELLCDKIILQQKVRNLQLHLLALQEVIKGKSKRSLHEKDRTPGR